MVRVSGTARPGLSFAVTPDFLDVQEAEVFARAMARWQPSDDAAQLLADRAADARAGQEFLDLFAISDARLWDPHSLWDRVTGADRLRIPLGKTPQNKVVWLDLKEGAEGGMGPHGMMTGQTGSGKSEHLLSFVLTMAMLHPPEQVQFLLGDFKGEATFAAVERLPHVQGVVSNLASSSHKLDRLEDVIRGEVMRREEVLKAAGYKNVRDYETARATTKPHLEPLGALLIVADEFSELLAIRPDMAKVFEHVGLVGRALWIHILNASQRVETGKMAGLIPQQTYSIGMKVKDAAQSRAAIGSSRAYEDLKRAPKGSAFLVVDDEHTRYRSFFVSAPFVEPKPSAARAHTEGHFVEAHRFTATSSALPPEVIAEITPGQAEPDDKAADAPDVDAPTILSVLANRIAIAGAGKRQTHRLWLPPLEDTAAIPLDELVGEFWGRDWRQVTTDAGLVIPYAREDDPFHHSQDVVAMNIFVGRRRQRRCRRGLPVGQVDDAAHADDDAGRPRTARSGCSSTASTWVGPVEHHGGAAARVGGGRSGRRRERCAASWARWSGCCGSANVPGSRPKSIWRRFGRASSPARRPRCPTTVTATCLW